jgi:hypothetical protein
VIICITFFSLHIEKGGAPSEWKAKLTMGELKPFVTCFVKTGITALKAPHMKLAVVKAFHDDGLFKLIRSDEQQEIAQTALSENAIQESRLTLPFTFGDVRRLLIAMEGQEEESDEAKGDEEIGEEDSDDEDDEEGDE